MFKKRKKLIIFTVIFALIILLFTPVPKKHSSDDSTVLTFTSLTYKVVIWNVYENSEKPYDKTEIIFFPNNYLNVQTLWEEKENDLRQEGYGAISSDFKVTKIEGKQIWIDEITQKEFGIIDCVIGEYNINKSAIGFTIDDIKVGDTLKISYSGEILESYPCTFAMIYKIEKI